MRIGIVAATSFEIQSAIDFLLQSGSLQLKHEFEILITGIGSLAATYQLTDFIQRKTPDYMIQAGIAGSFSQNLLLSDTVLVGNETPGDLGVEENGLFMDLFDMGFIGPSVIPYTNRSLINPHIYEWQQFGLPVVKGITVNEITTRPERISILLEKYQGDIESMEGAAFHYVCLQKNIAFLQLRSVSNYVGERDKTKWKLKDSITSLNNELIKIIQQIP